MDMRTLGCARRALAPGLLAVALLLGTASAGKVASMCCECFYYSPKVQCQGTYVADFVAAADTISDAPASKTGTGGHNWVYTVPFLETFVPHITCYTVPEVFRKR